MKYRNYCKIKQIKNIAISKELKYKKCCNIKNIATSKILQYQNIKLKYWFSLQTDICLYKLLFHVFLCIWFSIKRKLAILFSFFSPDRKFMGSLRYFTSSYLAGMSLHKEHKFEKVVVEKGNKTESYRNPGDKVDVLKDVESKLKSNISRVSGWKQTNKGGCFQAEQSLSKHEIATSGLVEVFKKGKRK